MFLYEVENRIYVDDSDIGMISDDGCVIIVIMVMMVMAMISDDGYDDNSAMVAMAMISDRP